MNTKRVCQEVGVTPKMLRVYEKAGLVVPERKENDYRDYSMDDLFRLEITVRLRDLGFSIKEIQSIFELETFKDMEESYLNAFYIQFKAIESKINGMIKTREKLEDAINKIINVQNEKNVMEIIHEMPATVYEDNAYDSLIKAWDFDNMAVDYINRFFKEDRDYKKGIGECRQLIRAEGAGKRIIDVGCGTCNLWEEFEEEYDLTALDSSLNMLTTARQKVPWAKYYFKDINNVDSKMFGKFDLVISTFTLHHIEHSHQHKSLINMLDLCADTGKIIIVDKYFKNKNERISLEKALEKAGAYDELTVLRSEAPVYLDEVEKIIEYMEHTVKFNIVTENIGCFVITRK